MHRILLLFAVTLGNLGMAAAPREIYYQGLLEPLNITPTFDKGYVFEYDRQKVWVFGPDGSRLFSISAEIANCKLANIDNAAVDSDGTIAGAVMYSMDATAKNEHGGIAVFDRSGKQVWFFDTGAYHPTQIAFGPDHSIWALGWPGTQTREWRDDFLILRNYSQQGQELGAFLPRSSFDEHPNPVGPMTGMWELRVIGDRVGAAIYRSPIYRPEEGPRQVLWLETDLKGKELGRWTIPAGHAPQAFTESGALYTHEGHAVSVFDRMAQAWRTVATPAEGILLGADGDDLVFLIRGTSTLRWVAAEQ